MFLLGILSLQGDEVGLGGGLYLAGFDGFQ